MIDEQRRQYYVRHFVLPGKNAVLQPSLENFQIRQTMCDTLFVRFSNMATNQATVNLLSLLLFSNSGFRVKCYIARYAIRIQANDKNYKSKEFANRYLLSLDLNTVTDDDSLMSNGKLFHNFEAATEYALSSQVFNLATGSSRSLS